jgi:hypothetical protein
MVWDNAFFFVCLLICCAVVIREDCSRQQGDCHQSNMDVKDCPLSNLQTPAKEKTIIFLAAAWWQRHPVFLVQRIAVG